MLGFLQLFQHKVRYSFFRAFNPTAVGVAYKMYRKHRLFLRHIEKKRLFFYKKGMICVFLLTFLILFIENRILRKIVSLMSLVLKVYFNKWTILNTYIIIKRIKIDCLYSRLRSDVLDITEWFFDESFIGCYWL